jgi:UDP-2,3-diacylglucosamine pyrophosphatase LpxH
VAFPLPAFLLGLIGKDLYERQVGKALDEACEDALPCRYELMELRAVAFSDHHRGTGDRADEFRHAEQAYCAALGWYLEQKPEYRLWLLGDVEELWENRRSHVMERYSHVHALEREFGDRLVRLYGNHDMYWRGKAIDGVPVHEAVRVTITDDGRELGTIVLAHGHQGTFDSGNFLFMPVSRFAVRVVWANRQRWFVPAKRTPARDAVLRHKHDVAMAKWADTKDGTALVAGHTHRPVFPGTQPPEHEELERAERALEESREMGVDQPGARADRELARVARLRAPAHRPIVLERPSYFNTGCCSFGDGDVTGLEFSGGAVRLIRWLDDQGESKPQELAQPLPLRDIFARMAV